MHTDDTDFSVYLIMSFGLPPHTLSRLLRFTWCRRRRLEPSVSMSKRHRNRLSRFQQIPPKHRILNELALHFLKGIRAEEKKYDGPTKGTLAIHVRRDRVYIRRYSCAGTISKKRSSFKHKTVHSKGFFFASFTWRKIQTKTNVGTKRPNTGRAQTFCLKKRFPFNESERFVNCRRVNNIV